MQELKIFENAEFGEVRTVELDGRPYFAGTDVARALGYSEPHKAVARHCRDDGMKRTPIVDGLGREQEAVFISEGNLYRLIVSSKLPSAERFERWVFDEVLPTIRRHGLYAIDDIIADPDLGIRALLALKAEREARKALEVENKIKDQQIAELKPKASYYDLILQCSGLLSVTEIAKDYGLSAKALNKMLHDLGIQFSQSGVWFLYSKYQSCGYTQTKTQNYAKPDGTQGARVHTHWTQKGRLFLYDLLKRRGVLPMIERTEAA